jgi:hypothetical protein
MLGGRVADGGSTGAPRVRPRVPVRPFRRRGRDGDAGTPLVQRIALAEPNPHTKVGIVREVTLPCASGTLGPVSQRGFFSEKELAARAA